jgi:hypothetical protein
MNWRFRLLLWCQFQLNAFVMGWMARMLLRDGEQNDFVRAMVQHPIMDERKTTLAANGGARVLATLEGKVAAFAQNMRPDSQWTFHKDEWQGREVVVLPRVMDSNTAIVMGPAGHPDLGAVVTCDGLPPNCDPPSLDFMLNGTPINMPLSNLGSGTIDAEFVEGAR